MGGRTLAECLHTTSKSHGQGTLYSVIQEEHATQKLATQGGAKGPQRHEPNYSGTNKNLGGNSKVDELPVPPRLDSVESDLRSSLKETIGTFGDGAIARRSMRENYLPHTVRGDNQLPSIVESLGSLHGDTLPPLPMEAFPQSPTLHSVSSASELFRRRGLPSPGRPASYPSREDSSEGDYRKNNAETPSTEGSGETSTAAAIPRDSREPIPPPLPPPKDFAEIKPNGRNGPDLAWNLAKTFGSSATPVDRMGIDGMPYPPIGGFRSGYAGCNSEFFQTEVLLFSSNLRTKLIKI